MRAFAGKIGDIGSDQADCDFDRCVFDLRFEVVNYLPYDEANRDAGKNNECETLSAYNDSGNVSGEDERHGKLKREQTARIVDETFSFDHRGDPLRKANAFRYRCSGDGIRGADHRTEHETKTKVKAWKYPLGKVGDSANGEQNQPQRQHRDANEVVAKFPP